MRYAPLLAATVVLLLTTVARASPPVPAESAVVRTGEGPCGVTAARGGRLWIGVYGAGRVIGIDPVRARITATVRGLPWACRVAVGPRAVWVTRDRANEIVRIPRGPGRVRHVTVGRVPFDLLLAHGSVWATSAGAGTIAQIDASGARPTRLYRDRGSPAGVTWCGGRVWVGHAAADVTWLTAVEPATHRLRRFDVGSTSPSWPRCVRGELWVTTRHSVLRVDPQTAAVLARIPLGGTPVEAAAGADDLVWVTDKERSLVFRVDPATNAVVDSFRAGPGAYAMARAGDSVWVTSFAGSDVRRYEIEH